MLELQSLSSAASVDLYHVLLAVGVAVCVGVMVAIAYRSSKH